MKRESFGVHGLLSRTPLLCPGYYGSQELGEQADTYGSPSFLGAPGMSMAHGGEEKQTIMSLMSREPCVCMVGWLSGAHPSSIEHT